jgi:hypothetical protein
VNEGVGVGDYQPNEVNESDGLNSLGDSDSDKSRTCVTQ